MQRESEVQENTPETFKLVCIKTGSSLTLRKESKNDSFQDVQEDPTFVVSFHDSDADEAFHLTLQDLNIFRDWLNKL